jgi:hypothetical protein
MSIEKVFLGSSKEVFYKIFICLQKWRGLLREDDAIFMGDKIKDTATGFPEAIRSYGLWMSRVSAETVFSAGWRLRAKPISLAIGQVHVILRQHKRQVIQ